MADVNKTVLIGHSAERMYSLVTDVASYPEFLPWCGGVDIYEQTETVLDAKIKIHFKGIEQYFIALREDACKIQFNLHWEFKNVILDKVIGPVFSYIAGTFVDCFVKRADQLYGS